MSKPLRTMLCLVVPRIVSSDSAAIKESMSTPDNLQTAGNGERNAQRSYLASAKKADEEGFDEVASLFCAAAKAEEIHDRNHSAVIRKMGATPALNLELIEVKPTRENLKTALLARTTNATSCIPNSSRWPRTMAAIRTSTFALKVEAVHAVLY